MAQAAWQRCRAFLYTGAIALLGASSAQAQVSTYSFAVTTGTYTDLGATGNAISVANNNDATSAELPIGFNFTYNGVTMTRFMLNTNGFIKLGTVGMTGPSTDALFGTGRTTSTGSAFSSTNAADENLISATNTDWNAGVGGTEYRYLTTGAVGSRTTTIQWKNVGDNWGNRQYQAANFQIVLTETSNTVQIKHGTWTIDPAGTNAFITTYAGLKGASGNVRSLTKASSSSSTASTTAGTGTTSSWSIARPTPPATTGLHIPVSGTTYTFTPPAPVTRAISGITATITAPVVPVTNVEVSSTNNVILRATVATTGNLGTLTLNSVAITTANTSATVSGAKLWYSTDATFSASTDPQIGTTQSISGGGATFSGLSQQFTLATAYLFVTFDIAGTATIGQTIDASIADGDIVITADAGATNPGGQPAAALNSVGTRTVGYCSSAATSAGDTDIGRVRLNTLDNVVGGDLPISDNAAATGTYTDFTAVAPTTLQIGESYTLRVNAIDPSGSLFAAFLTAFIDFNRDGDFNDPGEQVAFGTGSATVSNVATAAERQAQAIITVAAGATLGTTRMRVILSETAPRAACEVYTFGETEDYTVTIAPAPACPSPGGLSVTNVTSNSAEVSFSLGVGGTTTEVEFGPAGFMPGTGTLVTGLTSSPYTITGRLPQTAYDVYVRRDCGGSNSSRVGPLNFTTTKAPMAYAITRTEGISFSSIRPTDMDPTASAPVPFATTNADDQLSNEMSFSNPAFFPNGFNFDYPTAGTAVGGLKISTNGWLTFNTAETLNRLTNDLDVGTNTVAPYWDDLSGASTDSIRYALSGLAGSQVLTIEWMTWQRDLVTGSNHNFQVKLYEGTDRVEFVYGQMSQFDGAGNGTTLTSYSVGLNGNPTTQIASQQFENTAVFANLANDLLRGAPACNTRIAFVPGTYVAASDPTAAAPANDDCGSAIQVSVGEFPAAAFCTLYTTALATASPALPAVPVCTGPATAGTPDDDVWFAFTVPGVGSKAISVRAAGSYNFNPVLQLFSGTCAGFTAISCANVTTPTNGGSETILATALTGGQTYYARVYHQDVGAGGTSSNSTFGLDVFVTPPIPGNDEPAGAVAIGGATCTPINGTTLGATATATPTNPCAGTADDDVWYSVVLGGANNSLEVSLAGVGSFNGVLSLYSGAPTTNLSCANATTSGIEGISRSGLTAGTYYIRVHSLGALASNTGSFTICARTFVSVANDECAGAVALPVNATCVTTNGTTVNATGSTAPLPPTCSVTTPVNDVWYTVTGVTNLRLTVTGANFNPVVQLMTSTGGCAGTFTTVLCRNVSTTFTETLVSQGLTPATTYYVRVQGALSEPNGAFTICAQEMVAPANDQPAGAITLAVGVTGCNSPTAGTTNLATATASIPTCAPTALGTPDDDVWYKFTPTIASPSILVQEEAGKDMVVQLLREVPTGSGTFQTIECVDAVTGGAEQIDASGLVVGQPYFIRIYSLGSTATVQGDFTVCVSQQPKTVSTVAITQASTVAVGQGSADNPILRLQVRILGGVGNQRLQSITFRSNNSDATNADLNTNGVKLWVSRNTVFDGTAALIGSGRNFNGAGDVTFTPNYNFPGGQNYVYLTYNVKPTAVVGNTLDAQLLPTTVLIEGVNVTATTPNPTGTRAIAPPAPANDEPCAAIALTVQTVRPTFTAGTTNGAFDSSPTIVGTCQGLSNAEKDVFYRVIAPATGELNVDLRKPVGSTLGDTRLYLYSYTTCGGSLTVLDCDDDDGVGTLSSMHTTGLTPGATLMLRVAMDLTSDPTGTFEIAVTDRIIFTGGVSSALDPAVIGNFFPTIEPATVNANNPSLTTVLAASVVVAPANATTMPTAGTNLTLGGLDIRTGATLTHTAGTLTVNGATVVTGNFVSNPAATLALGTSGASASTLAVGAGTRTFENLTIGNIGAVLQGPGAVQIKRLLTLDGQLTTNGKPLTLLSDATGTAMAVNAVGGAVVGNARVQRYLDPSANPGLGYRHFSSPVTNTTVADLAATSFQPIVNSAYNAATDPNAYSLRPFPNVYDYAEPRITSAFPLFERGYRSPGDLTDALVSGRGYTVYLQGIVKPDFVGTLGNGDVTVPVENTNGLSNSGWNLLGNPYPSPIDWDSFAPATLTAAGLNVQVSVYKSEQPYANGLDGVYLTRANGMGSLTDGLIPMGQGIFVRRPATGSATLTFTNALRPLTYANPSHFRGLPTADTRPMVDLSLHQVGRVTADMTTVYFETGATPLADTYFDGYKLRSTGDMPSIFTRTATGDELAVNGLPLLDAATTTVVPLGVEVAITGAYKLNLAAIRNVPANVPVLLRDLMTGTTQDVRTNPAYAFSMDASHRGARFELVFGAANNPLGAATALGDVVVQVYPNPVAQNAELRVDLTNLPATVSAVGATLLDNLGRVVGRTSLVARDGALSGGIGTAGLARGVYSLRVQAGATTVVRRVVVE